MDSRRSREKRRTAKIPTQKGGRKDNAVRIKESRKVEKPDYAQKSSPRRDFKEDAQEKVKKLFEPVKDEIRLVIEYINILELRRDLNQKFEIMMLTDFIKHATRKCEFYLNAQLLKLGKDHG